MPINVVVVSELGIPRESLPHVTLDDDAATAISKGEGVLVKAINLHGPHAVFNDRQVDLLADELYAVSKNLPRNVQRDINDAVDYIRARTGGESHNYVVFVAK